MSCSSASHSVPRVRSSAASPLPSCRPQVSAGSTLFRRKPFPLVMRNGSTYFWMRSRISCLATAQSPFRKGGFDLECLHEALDLGVVVGIAAPAHGAGETVLLQDGAIVFGGILRPTVGMMHATPWRIAGADGGL